MSKKNNKSRANKKISVQNDSREALIKEIESLEPIKMGDSAKVINEKLEKQNEALRKLYTADSFTNQMARLGFGQDNLAEGTYYPMTRMTNMYTLWNSLYRGNWIVRKIVDVFPADMLKNWISIKSALEPAGVTKIEKAFRLTKTKEKIKQGLQWARLYGGAAALILIDGQDENLEEPLDYDMITPDSYKGLLVLDRWSGIIPSTQLIDDINDPDFGLPKYYTINTSSTEGANYLNSVNASGLRVHHSRIIRFTGRELPYWEKIAEMYWGESEIEIVYEELKKRDNTSYNIASMIFLANIRVLKMADLGQLLGTGSEHAQKNLENVISAQSKLMSNMGIYVMDKDDDFAIHNYSFSGLNEIYDSFMLDVAGACEMPVTKLFGREPSGFNATGESDLKQYYDTLTTKQEEYLQPVIDKLLPIVCMSSIGSIPDDLDWEFNPVFQVNNKDLADLAQSYMQPVLEAFQAGLITKEIALKELKQQSGITGMWTNITDEFISKVAKEEEHEADVYNPNEEKELESELEDDGDEEDVDEDANDSSEANLEAQEPMWMTKAKERMIKNG